MLDFELQRCTRRCAKTDREFRPGEPYVSVLLAAGSDVQRLDYSLDAWDGPPSEAIAWWKSQMPGGHKRSAAWAPHDVMLDYFQRLEADPANQDVRYVLALLMVRRRIFRLEHTERLDNGEEELVLYCARNETEYRVRSAMPTEERASEIQKRLTELLVTPTA